MFPRLKLFINVALVGFTLGRLYSRWQQRLGSSLARR